MDARRLGLVAVIAVLAAVGLAVSVAPERGDEPAMPRRSALVGAPVEAPSATAIRAPSPPVQRPSWSAPLTGAVQPPLPRGPERRPEAPIDPDEVLSPDQQGIAMAALRRRDRLVACWEDHRPPDATRLTLRFTITDAGEGAGAVAVDIPAMPTALGLHGCLNDAFSDARFVTPGEVAQSVMWAVPLPP